MSLVKCDYFWHRGRPYAAYGVHNANLTFMRALFWVSIIKIPSKQGLLICKVNLLSPSLIR